jgi:ATP-dependent Clp protease adaptor protein ClpS
MPTTTIKRAPPIVEPEVDKRTDLEPPWRILVHNDDVTPYDFVIHVLVSIFQLSREIAEHVTLVAHTTGKARVATRPKSEALRLIAKAHFAARLEDYPLTFSAEPENM